MYLYFYKEHYIGIVKEVFDVEEKIIKRKSLGFISIYMFSCMAILISMIIIGIIMMNYDTEFLLRYILFSNSFLMTFIIFFSLIGSIAGIISIIKDKNRKKLATIGIALNGMLVVCFSILKLINS